jgi:carbonic anhydrase
MISADEALERLIEGNRRFVSGTRHDRKRLDHPQRARKVESQSPFAVILGCSDSRVPCELVFDQGIGDLFVIRVAGNIVAPSQVGSIEFAAAQFGTPLVVVMGHSHCGAVIAAVEELERPSGMRSPNLGFIVKSIQPCVEPLVEENPQADRETLVGEAVRANILASAEQLRHGSEILESLIGKGGLRVVSAEYSLETGEVEFLGLEP